MPRPKTSVPAYLHHKPSGQAYTRIPDGIGRRKVVYLGAYGSDESRQKYARLLAEAAVTPAPAAPAPFVPDGQAVTVNDILLAFWRYAERHYRRADGTPTDELAQYRQTFRLVRDLYGRTLAAEFGPRSLKALRKRMIEVGWNRKLVNQRVGRVRRAFKWAASEELVPPATYQALTTAAGLQAGRTEARETDPGGPVADDHVRAALPFVRPAVGAIARGQELTGMGRGEECHLRRATATPPGRCGCSARSRTRHGTGTSRDGGPPTATGAGGGYTSASFITTHPRLHLFLKVRDIPRKVNEAAEPVRRVNRPHSR